MASKDHPKMLKPCRPKRKINFLAGMIERSLRFGLGREVNKLVVWVPRMRSCMMQADFIILHGCLQCLENSSHQTVGLVRIFNS